jgi:hypothetical protein
MTDLQTYVVDEIPADVRVVMAQMLSDTVTRDGCLIIEEDTWEQFVNAELETARIQDGLDEPDIVQDFEDNPEYDEVLFQQYLNKACCTCGGPCEPGACEVLTGDEWGMYYG